MVLRALGLVSAAALCLGTAASAATFTGSYSVNFNTEDPGLIVDVAPHSAAGSIDLDVGESFVFNIFDIWTPEDWVHTGEDDVAKPISVDFVLTAPAAGNGSATGSTVGNSILFGLWQDGSVSWDSPLTLSFGTTGELLIELTDATFQPGYFGLSDPFGTYEVCKTSKHDKGGKKKDCETHEVFNGAEIFAKVTYLTADSTPASEPPAPVPLPAAGGLLLAAMGGLAALRRRR